MKLHALSPHCAGLALALATTASFAQTAAPSTDAPKAGKVAQAGVPASKAAVARAGAKQQSSTPATTLVSPHEDRRFQNCHGKDSDA